MRKLLLEKLVLQSLISTQTKLRIFRQQFSQKNITVLSPSSVTHRLVYHYVTSLVLSVSLVVTLALHRIEPQQQHVTYYTVTKHIAFVIVRLLVVTTVLYHLRSHVTHSTTTLVTLTANSLVHKQRQTEVYYTRLVRSQVYKNVLRLQVPVDNVGLVDIPNSLENRSQKRHNNSRVVQLLLLPESHQILARQVLHNEHKMPLLFKKLLEFIHVGTFNQTQYLSLLHHQILSRRVVFVLFTDYLGCEYLPRQIALHLLNLPANSNTLEKLPLPIGSINS